MNQKDLVKVLKEATEKKEFWGPWMPKELFEEVEGQLLTVVKGVDNALKARVWYELSNLYNRTVNPDKTISLKGEMLKVEKEAEPYVVANFYWQLMMATGPVVGMIDVELSDWGKAVEYGEKAVAILEKENTHPRSLVDLRARLVMLKGAVETGRVQKLEKELVILLGGKYLT